MFSAPEYDAEFISIPGRSGDIINPNRRFANIKVTYTVFLARKNIAALAAVLRDIKGWLYSEPDRYHEITDSYDAEYFRYGVISGNLDIEEQLNKVGSFTVTFNCKPYKYSLAGQETVSADASELTITNPTAFESRPYIKLYGSGAVALLIQPQGRGMMISDLDEYIEIDSELMNCFKGTALKNDTVKCAEYPVFKSGVCTINCTGDEILSEKNIDAFNGAQGRILYVLWQEDGISIRSLSIKCGLAITSLTTMLERMEHQGLIRRIQSETDKRKTLLFLTEKAHALKGEYDSVSDEMGSIYYKGFSEEEITRFEECLDRIRKNLEEWQKS